MPFRRKITQAGSFDRTVSFNKPRRTHESKKHRNQSDIQRMRKKQKKDMYNSRRVARDTKHNG